MSSNLKRHLDRFSHFCGAHVVRDRQTDRPRCSICNNRPLQLGTAMRPNNNNDDDDNDDDGETAVGLRPPYVIGQVIYIFILWFLLLLLSFFSSPNLSGRRLGVTILPHMAWP